MQPFFVSSATFFALGLGLSAMQLVLLAQRRDLWSTTMAGAALIAAGGYVLVSYAKGMHEIVPTSLGVVSALYWCGVAINVLGGSYAAWQSSRVKVPAPDYRAWKYSPAPAPLPPHPIPADG